MRPRSGCFQEDLEGLRLRGSRQCGERPAQREDIRDERGWIDNAALKGFQRGPKSAASRTNHFDFVDYDRRQVYSACARHRRLEDKLAAGTYQLERAGEPRGGAGAVRDHVEAGTQLAFKPSRDSHFRKAAKLVLMMPAEHRV